MQTKCPPHSGICAASHSKVLVALNKHEHLVCFLPCGDSLSALASA